MYVCIYAAVPSGWEVSIYHITCCLQLNMTSFTDELRTRDFFFFFCLRIVDYLFLLYVSTAKRRKEEGEARRQIWIRRTTLCFFFLSNSPQKALEMHFSTFKCCLKVHSDFFLSWTEGSRRRIKPWSATRIATSSSKVVFPSAMPKVCSGNGNGGGAGSPTNFLFPGLKLRWQGKPIQIVKHGHKRCGLSASQTFLLFLHVRPVICPNEIIKRWFGTGGVCSRGGDLKSQTCWKRLSSAPRKATDACVYVHTHYTQPQGRIECRKIADKTAETWHRLARERAAGATDTHVQAHADELTAGLRAANALQNTEALKKKHATNTERLQKWTQCKHRNTAREKCCKFMKQKQDLANRGTKVRDGPILWD